MADQNNPQITDADYQPRSRRERRELEARLASTSSTPQVAEKHSDAPTVPVSARLGRHADTSSTKTVEDTPAAGSSAMGRHALHQSTVVADTAQSEAESAKPEQLRAEHAEPSIPVVEEAEQGDQAEAEQSIPQIDGSAHVATSKWLDSIKKAQGVDSSTPMTGIIETRPLKLKKSFLKNGYLGYSSLGSNSQGDDEELKTGYSAPEKSSEPQTEASRTTSASNSRTSKPRRARRSTTVRKPVSRDTRSISLSKRSTTKEDTVLLDTVPEEYPHPRHMELHTVENKENTVSVGRTKKSNKEKKPELTLKEAREQGRVGEWVWTQFRESALVVVYALVIAFIIKTFLVRGFYIPSGSMENTLQVNDRVFINVAGSYFGDPNRGDVVVFKDTQGWIDSSQKKSNPINDALTFIGVLPDTSSNYLVKRVIGKPGDRVESDGHGKIKVNGTEITEPYLHPGSNPSDVPFSVVVPDDSYFVMGDHRDHSADSRYHIGDGHAFIKRGDIQGNVFIIAWPLNHFGTLTNESNVFSSVPEPSK